MNHPLMLGLAAVVALAVAGGLGLTRFARSDRWLATVTPLASIIGSGFLISGPLLAHEFGLLAAPAMAVLLLIAYAVGAVIRFNIRHAEPCLAKAHSPQPVRWTARVGQGVLAVAYAISVAYYLKLLAAFTLHAAHIQSSFIGNAAVTAIIAVLMLLAFSGGLRRVEHVAHGSVSIKLGLIAAMLVALALDWGRGTTVPVPMPPPRLSLASIPMLLGLLITVQGFETSRYMGDSYPPELRVATMRTAQLFSAAIYLVFLVLLTPRLGEAAQTSDVAGVIDVMRDVAPFLGFVVLAAAVASQLSAAIADSIGSTGIAVELSGRRLGVRSAYPVAGGLAILVTWLTDPLTVIALASRAFALFYAIQCLLALLVARAEGKGTALRVTGFLLIGLVCLAAAAVGAPAGG